MEPIASDPPQPGHAPDMTSPHAGDAEGPWWGTAAAATQCEGAAAPVRLGRVGGRGPCARLAGRQRLPHPLRRTTSRCWPSTASATTASRSSGPASSPGPAGGTTTRWPTLRRVLGAARAAGRRRRGRACSTDRRPGWFTDDQRGLARRQGRAHLGAPRRPGGRGGRRPGGRVGPDPRARHWPRASGTSTARSLPAGGTRRRPPRRPRRAAGRGGRGGPPAAQRDGARGRERGDAGRTARERRPRWW